VNALARTGPDNEPAGGLRRWLYHGRRHQRRFVNDHRTAATLIGVAVVALLVFMGVTLLPSTQDRSVVLPESPSRPAPETSLSATLGTTPDPFTPTPSSIPTAPPVPPPTQPSQPDPPTRVAPKPPPARIIIPVTTIEAESAQNTLNGTARIHTVPEASGGQTIGNIGRGSANTLRINGLNVPQTGTYTLTIFYISGDGSRAAAVNVNGIVNTVTFPATGDWDTVGSLTTRVSLRAGTNTITFVNAANPAPDFDRIRLGP
jgi:hypothetical protein